MLSDQLRAHTVPRVLCRREEVGQACESPSLQIPSDRKVGGLEGMMDTECGWEKPM